MQYCVDHPEEFNKLSKVKAQVAEVKGVMMENIEKVRHNTAQLILIMIYARKGFRVILDSLIGTMDET